MNIKLLKAQSILQEALQETLYDLADTRLKNLTITKIELSGGKESAKVFFDENSLLLEKKEMLLLLKKASGIIRSHLQTQLSWYKIPKLSFEIDDSLAKINRLDDIFRKIHSKDLAKNGGDLAKDSIKNAKDSMESSGDFAESSENKTQTANANSTKDSANNKDSIKIKDSAKRGQ